MTDKKQIIIDGVRVDECCYFDYENDGYEDSCYIHQNECSAQNCYYKQLARKTQEYSELLKQHKELDDKVNRMIEEKYNLARECEALKKELKDMTVRKIEYLNESLKYQIECEELRVAYNKAQDIIGRINRTNELKSYSLQESIKECDRYRKVLKKIKKYCNAQNLKYDYTACEILNIIDKAKG